MAVVKTGFIRVPKTHPRYAQRWYYNPETGQEITRTAHQTLQKGGLKPKEVAKIRKVQGVKTGTSKYSGFVQAYKINTARKLGIKPKDVRVRGNTKEAVEFRAKYAQLKKLASQKNVDKSATGDLAKILTELNMRQPEMDRPVGES